MLQVLHGLHRLHRNNIFLGALHWHAITFTPLPKFCDLAIGPFIESASPELVQKLNECYFIHPTVLQSQRPSLEGDIYAVAKWYSEVLDPSAKENPDLQSTLAGDSTAIPSISALIAALHLEDASHQGAPQPIIDLNGTITSSDAKVPLLVSLPETQNKHFDPPTEEFGNPPTEEFYDRDLNVEPDHSQTQIFDPTTRLLGNTNGAKKAEDYVPDEFEPVQDISEQSITMSLLTWLVIFSAIALFVAIFAGKLISPYFKTESQLSSTEKIAHDQFWKRIESEKKRMQ